MARENGCKLDLVCIVSGISRLQLFKVKNNVSHNTKVCPIPTYPPKYLINTVLGGLQFEQAKFKTPSNTRNYLNQQLHWVK